MDDFQTMSIFGGTANNSQLLPGQWNPTGATPDVGTIISDEVQRTISRVVGATIGDPMNSGGYYYYGQQNRGTSLLIMAALVYFLVVD